MQELAMIALAVFGFAMVSGRLSMSPVTAPMVFTTIGLVFGLGGLGWFDLELEGEAISILVEATLVLVLFSDATRIDVRALGRGAGLPIRLLVIGLPLTVVAGTGIALLTEPSFGLIEAALLAAILTPTDAALGQAVVSDRRLPVRIRQALNVESGLNDGLVVPVVAVLIAAAAAGTTNSTGAWVGEVARQLGFGLPVGVAIGFVGGKLIESQVNRGAVERVYQQLATLAVAVLAYTGSSLVGGNGFVAAFVGGLAFGQVARGSCERLRDFTEDESELLSAITFLVFGAAIVGPLLGELSPSIALYAIASLTVVRGVPVLISLVGSGTLTETRLFLAWFGPRGLASVLFALLVLEQVETPAGELIFAIAAWTVLLSVFAHGLSATVWSRHLSARLAAETEPMEEMKPARELPLRRTRRIAEQEPPE